MVETDLSLSRGLTIQHESSLLCPRAVITCEKGQVARGKREGRGLGLGIEAPVSWAARGIINGFGANAVGATSYPVLNEASGARLAL